MPTSNAFDRTFETLRKILHQHAKKLQVIVDRPGDYQLASRDKVDRIGRPLFVAGVVKRKSYISFHLMPVYAFPDLLAGLTPELKKRIQGKSCFNFKAIDAAQVKELERLTRVGIERFKKVELPWD
jgi:hypothetical protein